jgi:hypothetical protein
MCQVVTFLHVILRPHTARRGAFAGASVSARRSSPRAAGIAPLGRQCVLPAALMGFNPSQLCSGRTVPPAFSAAGAHVSFAGRIFLDGFGRGISRQNSMETDCGRSECVQFDFWTLTRPTSHPPPVVGRGTDAALGFASLGIADTRSCRIAGSSPPSLIDRRPIRFRRLSALGLQRRSPALPVPRWFADQNRSRRLLFSDSGDRCLALPTVALPKAG